MDKISHFLAFLAIITYTVPACLAIDCQLIEPIRESENQIGFIFFPGAYIPGEQYSPLVSTIQNVFGESMWGGVTYGWSGNLVNPVQAATATQICIDKANAANLNTDLLFFGGHSLGGIVLQNFISNNLTLAQGLLLYGSWLNVETNQYPIPTMGLTGTIDGLSLSQFAVEVMETSRLSEAEQNYTFSVMVDTVNHGQVASGELPQDVIEDDIDPEVSLTEAHLRYADVTNLFITYLTPEFWSQSVKDEANSKLNQLRDEALLFYQPFYQISGLESDGLKSPWVELAQGKLLGSQEENALENGLQITDESLSTLQFSRNSPTLVYNNNTLTFDGKTFSHLQHKAVDFDTSATTIKAKMKSAASILTAMGMQGIPEDVECGYINSLAFEEAFNVASEEALGRFQAKGRQMLFGPDIFRNWTSNWESELGLQYTDMPFSGTVELRSYKLVSDESFDPPGMNYCDLFSPYRAVEWIYIYGVKHGFYT